MSQYDYIHKCLSNVYPALSLLTLRQTNMKALLVRMCVHPTNLQMMMMGTMVMTSSTTRAAMTPPTSAPGPGFLYIMEDPFLGAGVMVAHQLP